MRFFLFLLAYFESIRGSNGPWSSYRTQEFECIAHFRDIVSFGGDLFTASALTRALLFSLLGDEYICERLLVVYEK